MNFVLSQENRALANVLFCLFYSIRWPSLFFGTRCEEVSFRGACESREKNGREYWAQLCTQTAQNNTSYSAVQHESTVAAKAYHTPQRGGGNRYFRGLHISPRGTRATYVSPRTSESHIPHWPSMIRFFTPGARRGKFTTNRSSVLHV